MGCFQLPLNQHLYGSNDSQPPWDFKYGGTQHRSWSKCGSDVTLKGQPDDKDDSTVFGLSRYH